MHIKCPLCESINSKFYTNSLRFDQYADVYQCLNCTLIFIDQNSFKFPKNFYETEYHQTYLTHIDPDILDPQIYFEKMLKANAPWVNKVKEMLTGNESILDVGCSTGHFLMGIKDHADKVYGHELNIKEVDFCKNILGLDVNNIPLEDRFLPNSFDIITLMFVLEHIGDPIPFLNHLKTFLKPHGKIIILVPNILDSLVNLYDINDFHKFYFCIEHLFYYSPKTINLLLEKTGLQSKTECVQEYPITNHLNWIYRQKPQDVIGARSNVPYTHLKNVSLQNEMQKFWEETNKRYHKILSSNGYGDRIFCVAKYK